MKILVTGAGGQLGKGIKRYWQNEDNLLFMTKNQLDITDVLQVEHLMESERPDVVINCAAKTGVDMLETNESLAYAVNSVGAANVARGCEKIGAAIVQVSTDYVFDGSGNTVDGEVRPYIEGDKENPLTVYGASKLEGEVLVRASCSRAYIVRTAWLFGSGNRFTKKILERGRLGETVRVVDDQYGTATSVRELVGFIENLIRSDEYGLYHASCEGVCTWYDVATFMFEKLSLKGKTERCGSDEYTYVAKRPSYTVLENNRLRENGLYCFSHWKDAMAQYIEDELRR